MEKKTRVQKVNDYYVNQYGVKIPVKDVEQFRRNVDAINKRASRQLEKYSKFERMIDNKPTGATVGDMMKMGYEPELPYWHRTANLNQFRTEESFRKRLKSTQKALEPGYYYERIRQYKKNYVKGLRENFGDDAEPLIKGINAMSLDKFIKLSTSNPDQLSIKAQYSEEGKFAHLYQLSNAWGLKKSKEKYLNIIEPEE